MRQEGGMRFVLFASMLEHRKTLSFILKLPTYVGFDYLVLIWNTYCFTTYL